MRFRTKIILGYTAVALVAALCLGGIYYSYNVRESGIKAYNDTRFLSNQLVSRFEESMDTMKQISDYILSDPKMLSAIRTLASRQYGNDSEMEEEEKILSSGITTDYIIRNFHRVLIYNEYGDVAYSTNFAGKVIDPSVGVGRLSWIEGVKGKRGKAVIIGPHMDEWGIKDKKEVYSLCREIQGASLGYIEVQRTAESLKEIFEVPLKNVTVAIILDDGSFLYSSGTDDCGEELLEAAAGPDGIIRDGNSLTAVATSEKYGAKVIVAQRTEGMAAGIARSAVFALIVSFCFFSISMAFIVAISSYLVRPMRRLKEQMEHTGIENMGEIQVLETTNDEVEALSRSYQQLLNRLSQSIDKEKKLSLLQVKAQFDALQAQIDPHFLYNVLNVISSRGVMNDDEEICEICGSLAAMLRYSTNTIKRYASVREETGYLKRYIYLLRSRYEERMEVKVDIDAEIEGEILPKITLQQIVENSIKHGFSNRGGIMRICIRGYRDTDGWYLVLQDNGQGISEESRRELHKNVRELKERILMQTENIEMEIGGMGLASTFARLYLLYGEMTVFEVDNASGGGCRVILGVRKGA